MGQQVNELRGVAALDVNSFLWNLRQIITGTRDMEKSVTTSLDLFNAAFSKSGAQSNKSASSVESAARRIANALGDIQRRAAVPRPECPAAARCSRLPTAVPAGKPSPPQPAYPIAAGSCRSTSAWCWLSPRQFGDLAESSDVPLAQGVEGVAQLPPTTPMGRIIDQASRGSCVGESHPMDCLRTAGPAERVAVPE